MSEYNEDQDRSGFNSARERTVDTVHEILAAHARRVKHVHLHDNNGGALDLHLPLGAGSIKLPETVDALKATGYDGTITLEVFAPDRNYLLYSRDVLRQLWNAPRSAPLHA